MLKPVQVGHRKMEDYREIIGDSLFAETRQAAEKLAGKRVLHINSTADAGGVAEILRAEIPLLQDLGVQAEWHVLVPEPGLFDITARIHDGLQGATQQLSEREWDFYIDYSHRLAGSIDADEWDIIMVHDPQPMPLRHFAKHGRAKWVWRYHADCSNGNSQYLKHLQPFAEAYDAAVFTLKDYRPAGWDLRRVEIIPVAIDPLSVKNRPIERHEAVELVTSFGINPIDPLVTQVSRFDRWKDPVGVIEAWRLARASTPDLQLALVGNSASDNPEDRAVLGEVFTAAEGQSSVFIIDNRADDRAVKAFQTVSNVVLQKSLREGFGLTVSEALWCGTPVVAGNVGGIPLQIEDGKNGYLVNSLKEAAQRVAELVHDPAKAKAMGEYGRELVRRKFLLPRMMRDDLDLWSSLL